jgi:hypothetical protein
MERTTSNKGDGESGDSGGHLSNSIMEVAKAAKEIPTELKYGDRGAAAPTSLLRSPDLLCSQSDPMRDPADPVWRVVTVPENEEHWNAQFSETYFHTSQVQMTGPTLPSMSDTINTPEERKGL